MKKILLLTILLSLPALAGGVPGTASGPVQSVEMANVISPLTTINAQCVTPTAGCSAGQAVTIKIGGRNSVTAQVTTANFTGTIQPFVSFDGGVTWTASNLKLSPATAGQWTTTSGFAASTATNTYAIGLPYGGITDVMLASTAAVTNTLTAQLIASGTVPNALAMMTASKGTQPATTAWLSTQNAKDAGRTYVAIGADGVTPAIAETVVTFSKVVADTLTATQTSYTITNGKIFRIQSICASFTAGAAANRVRLALRMNTGGACIAGSNILLPAIELAPNYGTATAAEGGASGCVAIPDGLEITGNGTKAICLSESATAASGTLTANLIGFEY